MVQYAKLFLCFSWMISLVVVVLAVDPTPSSNVQAVHNTPRTNGATNTFTISSAYFLGTLVVPCVILGLGILSIFLFQCSLCFRCCCRCCKHAPYEGDIESKYSGDTDAWQQHIHKNRKFLFIMYLIFVTFALVTIHIIYVGNDSLNQGVYGMMDVLDYLKNLFITIAKAADQIFADGKSISADISQSANQLSAQSTCNPVGISLTAIASHASAITSSSLSITGLIRPLTDALEAGKSYLLEYAVNDKNLVIFMFYAFIVFTVILYYVFLVMRLKIAVQFVIIFTEIIIIALTFTASVFFIFLQIAADLCVAPTALLLSQLHGELYKMASYYIDCQGNDPLNGYIGQLNDLVSNFPSNITAEVNDKLNAASPSLQATCTPLVAPMFTIQPNITDATNQLTIIGKSLKCDLISSHWHQLINQDLCIYEFDGLFTIMLIMYLTAGFLFATICIASVLYQYFGIYWHMGEHSNNEGEATAPPVIVGVPIDVEEDTTQKKPNMFSGVHFPPVFSWRSTPSPQQHQQEDEALKNET